MFLKNEMKLSPDQVAKALNHSDPIVTLRGYFHGTPTAEGQEIFEENFNFLKTGHFIEKRAEKHPAP